MIFDTENRTLIGNLGWIDKGSLWVYSIDTGAVRLVPVGDQASLMLRPGTNGYFMVVCGTSISIRRVAEPQMPLAAVNVTTNGAQFVGNSSLWRNFDRAVRISDHLNGSRYVMIDEVEEVVREVDTSWYTNGPYDHDYQELMDCMTLSDGHTLIGAVQRSSTLVLVDLEENRKVGSIELAGRNGNPELALLADGDVLASDYDAICRVRLSDPQQCLSLRLQGAIDDSMRAFIGKFCINGDGTILVARPFSADVLHVDMQSLSIIGQARIGGKPLVPHLIASGKVLARDWETGIARIGFLEEGYVAG